MKTIENKLASVCDTQEYARSLAKKYGKKPLLILLSGNLGAGKTTFAQAFLRQLLNNNISIPSPTYSYMNSYMGNFSIYHFDLYRIEEPNEIYDLGLADALMDPHALRLVEWPQRMPSLFDKADIIIKLHSSNGFVSAKTIFHAHHSIA